MHILKPIKNGLQIQVAASFTDIDLVCNEIEKFLKKYKCEKNIFDVILGSREALVNAVRYGAKLNLDIHVIYRIRITPKKIVICVKDPGEGFDWRKKITKKYVDLETHGRGIQVFKEYFDMYKFNNTGNQLLLVKNIGKEVHK